MMLDDTYGMIQWLDTNMLHNAMSPQLTAVLSSALTDSRVAGQPAATLKSLAVYLVAASPEYQVQR